MSSADFWVDKVDSILFRAWLLIFKGKTLPVTDYSGSDPYGVQGIDEEGILSLIKDNNFEVVEYEKYAPRKTRFVTWIDSKFIKTNHQFRILAKKK